MQHTEQQVQTLVYPYPSVIAQKLNGIYDAWDREDVVLALQRTMKLVSFLVPAIRKELDPYREQIEAEMLQATKISGVRFLPEESIRSRNMRAVAQKWFKPFLEKLIDLLAERGYLEKVYLSPKEPLSGTTPLGRRGEIE